MSKSNRPFNPFTKTATARLLGVALKSVNLVREFAHAVWVHVLGKRPTFVSKDRYRADFLAQRQEAAKVVQATRHADGSWTTWNAANGNVYEVVPANNPQGYRCECEDNSRQSATYGFGVCKHLLAVKAALLSDQLIAA